MFGSHSVYSRTLTEDIKCKWTKSFAQLDQFLPLLSTKPTVFNALGPGVFLFLFLFCWIQDRKQTLQSVLAFARDPPPRWQHSLGAGAFSPECRKSTCGQKRQHLRRVQDDNCHAGDVADPRSVLGFEHLLNT